ncbi:MAG: hypothetical protein HC910_17975 [Spirulinaceae cyanobacterium SM2_1_0]|nr:hypothetical protein [Spirulinaceae cyanobacterium SM2_1_0]
MGTAGSFSNSAVATNPKLPETSTTSVAHSCQPSSQLQRSPRWGGVIVSPVAAAGAVASRTALSVRREAEIVLCKPER